MSLLGSLELVGCGGEPVSFRRLLTSHGVASLSPQRIDLETWTFETTAVIDGAAHTVVARESSPGLVTVELGPTERTSPRSGLGAALVAVIRHMLRLDDDLSPFYARAARDPVLSWVCLGAGRMIRSPSVFEDVVKTLCTTNCAWSATMRMTDALVRELGVESCCGRRSFPAPQAMATAGDEFYREVARCGYRGSYLLDLARDVAEGSVDLEALVDPSLSDAEVEARLLALPGVGPYAAAHVMLTSLGRYSKLVLDSWTRPTYAALIGRPASDRSIEQAYRKYGRYAGLAFWLTVTKDWLDAP